jgi:hypothetical protein
MWQPTEMEPRHPYSDATYRVIRQPDRSFGVEVTIPETHPTRVSSFTTEADAEAWIVAHKKRVANLGNSGRSRWIKKRSPGHV